MVMFAMAPVSEPVPEWALLLLDVPVELLPELQMNDWGGHRRRVRQRQMVRPIMLSHRSRISSTCARPPVLLDAPDQFF